MTHLSRVRAAGMLLLLSSWASAQAGTVAAVPVHRFWSPVLQSGFYTIDEVEKAEVLSRWPEVWRYEGVAFRALLSGEVEGSLPVHRFWSPVFQTHFYTLDDAEKAQVLSQWPDVWTYEGVVFYAYPASARPEGTLPVHRFWSAGLGDHLYTASDTERFTLVGGDPGVWDYEGAAWYAYPPETEGVPAFVKGPWVQAVAANSATIVWQTDVAADSAIHYDAGALGSAVVRAPEPVTRHQITLTGLVPNVLYAYRANSGSAERTGTFRTAPSPSLPFRFAVCGDTQSDAGAYGQIAAALATSGAEIVLHAGDLTDAGRDYGLWDTQFFGPGDSLLGSVPVVPVPGNHEYAGSGPLWFSYFFDRPLEEGWFAMSYGNARFIGLNTNVDFSAGSRQYDWLVQELQSPACQGAKWRIVVLHHPPFTATTRHSDTVTVQQHLVPLFDQHGVDVVFSGHSHAYERYLYHGISYIVTGGGGGSLYGLTTDKALPIRLVGASVHHYCLVEVDPGAGTLVLTAVGSNGQVLDTLKLSERR